VNKELKEKILRMYNEKKMSISFIASLLKIDKSVVRETIDTKRSKTDWSK
jgi:hypothetical protein